MKDFLAALWTKSALPVLFFVILLVAGGTYLQYSALQIQNRPITVNVNSRTAVETINIQFDEIDTIPESSSNLSEVSLLLGQNENEKALELLLAYSGDTNNAGILFSIGLVKNRLGDKTGAINSYKKALQLKPSYFEASFNLGNLYLALKRYDLSVMILEKTVALAGGVKRSRTLSSLGIAYHRVGKYSLAEESLIESVNLDPSSLKPRFELAELYADTGRMVDAEDIYNEILLLDELNSQAYIGLAELSLANGDVDTAITILNETLIINSNLDEARIKLALLLVNKGEPGQAKSHLVWIATNGNNKEAALFQLDRIEYSQHRFNDALNYYLQAFNLSEKTNIESLNNLGITQKALGNLEDAKLSFMQAVEIDEMYYKAHYNLGLLYLDEEEYQNAEKAFNLVLSLKPDHPEAWHNLAFVFSQKGMYRVSIDAYEETLRIEPSNIKARLNLAVQYRKLDEMDMALEQYQLVLSINPSYSSAWYNQALLFKAIGKYAEAERSYNKAIELNPEEVKYWLNLSTLLSSLGRISDSIQVLKDGIDAHSNSDLLRYNLALQYKKTDSPGNAKIELEKAVSLNPGNVKAWLVLGDIESDNKNHGTAAEYYLTAVNLEPEDAYSKYQLGKELYKLNKYEDALVQFNDSVKIITNNAWIWYNLGKTQQKLDLMVESETSFRETLAIDPNMARYVKNQFAREEDTIEILTDMLSTNGNNIELRIQLAELLARNGNYEKSLDEYNNALEIERDNDNILLSMGNTAYTADDLFTAEKAFKQLVLITPREGEHLFIYGKLLYELEKTELAFNYLSLAVNFHESPLEVLRFYGSVLYDEKNYDKSAEIFIRAVDLDPSDGKTIIDLGKSYYKMKKYRESLRYFTNSTELLPEYEWSYIWEARAMAKLGLYDNAVRSYNKAVFIKPEFIQSYIGLGDLEVSRNRNQEAAVYYRRALKIDTDHASTRRKLDKINS